MKFFFDCLKMININRVKLPELRLQKQQTFLFAAAYMIHLVRFHCHDHAKLVHIKISLKSNFFVGKSNSIVIVKTFKDWRNRRRLGSVMDFSSPSYFSKNSSNSFKAEYCRCKWILKTISSNEVCSSLTPRSSLTTPSAQRYDSNFTFFKIT